VQIALLLTLPLYAATDADADLLVMPGIMGMLQSDLLRCLLFVLMELLIPSTNGTI